MVQKVKRRKRITVVLVCTMVVLIFSIFGFHVVSWHYYINSHSLCTYSLLYDSDLLTKLYDYYSMVRVVVSGLIDILIAVVTHITLRVLRG